MSILPGLRILVIVAACAAVAQGKVVYVSTAGSDAGAGLSWGTAKKTVQAGLDAATAGDQVWVAAGTYVECIALVDGVGLYGGFAGGETDLSQRNWRANVTILDGNQGGSVVTGPTGATASTRIDGFTIRNGKASQYGGGIYCSSSSPMIANNIITGNTASAGGGGISCSSSSPTITNNTIIGNMASFDGGGISCVSSLPTITNNTITGNTASYSGGGISCFGSSATITNNTITDNTASGYGGGIFCSSSSATITNNTISGNTASTFSGGGIYCSSVPSPAIANNTITGNMASSDGGGISCAGSSPTIVNTIIAFNSSGISGTQTLRCCCVYGNGAYNFSGLNGTNGNISVDPQLVDVARGNIHLQPTSPCIDAGDDTAVQVGWTDIDGQARVQGAHVDIGADESDGTSWPAAAAIVYVSPSGSDSNDGSSWANAKRTVQAGIDAGGTGSQVWVAAGIYFGTIQLKFGMALYGGFAGSETNLSQRNWWTNLTILDGNQAGSVVTAPTAATASTRIDGFTIRKGKASYGRGICCCYSSPTITNNTITGNTASYGAGIYCSSSSPTITNNTIIGNAASYGGGLYCEYSSSPTITNNTIAGNAASYGGGIYCSSSSSPTITNTIIASNSSGIYGYSGTPTLLYCCVYGNVAYNFSGLTDPTGTSGNISADPQLADVGNGNVHLQPTSPCIDAGDDTAVQAGWTDIDGQARVQGAHADIGADESDGTSWPAAAAIVYVSPGGNDSNDGLSWASAKRTVQGGIDAGGTGSQVWVAAGTYAGTVRLGFGMALYGGFAGGETDLSQRNWRMNLTILDGNQGGSVVTALPVATASTRIDGFTIRNGKASSYGGGIYCNGSSPTITNNTISGNNASSYGGGIYCSYSSPTIANNIITGNTASQFGGGIYCDNSSSPTITNNTITSNTAFSGGGVHCYSSSPMIASNTITGNMASSSGGGGVHCYSSSPVITNTIIALNSSGIYSYSGIPTLRYCCVYGNTSYNYSGLTDPTGGYGNISVDPLFIHQTTPYDLHLLANSPCINIGDPSFNGNALVDLDGYPRVFGGRVDMGAYEFVPHPPTIITSSPLAGGKVGVTYSLTFQVGDGVSPYTWCISAGSVPAGMNLSSSGVLSGTPTAVVTASFTVQVTGRDGSASTKGFTLVVAPPDLPGVPGNPSPVNGQINVSVSSILSWSGAGTYVTFDVYLDTVNPPVTKIASGVSTVSQSPSLAAGTRYYWQVVATNVSGQTPGPIWSFATHLAGDINGDGFVNVGDLQLLVRAWGSDNSGGWGNWNASADLNNDGYVNVSDLQILVTNWGSASR